jgi:hypothetical protein
MTRASYVALNRRGAACVQDVGSGWRTLKQNSRATLVASECRRQRDRAIG